MSGRINATIDLTKVYEALKNNHSAIQEGSDGHLRANVTIWINDEVKEFASKKPGGNPIRQDSSIQLNSRKDASEDEKATKVYIGNGLSTFAAGGGAVAANYGAFGGKAADAAGGAASSGEDDLPF